VTPASSPQPERLFEELATRFDDILARYRDAAVTFVTQERRMNYVKQFRGEELEKLSGCVGRMAGLEKFSATKAHLVISIRRDPPDEDLFLVFWECDRIEASLGWRFSLPQVAAIDGNWIELRDERAGFKVRCAFISVTDRAGYSRFWGEFRV
jgi:hypothetical protein